MTDDHRTPPAGPPLDPVAVGRALRAVLPEDEAKVLVEALEAPNGWFPLAPGLNTVTLAIAVTSPPFAAWFRSTLQHPEEIRIVDHLLRLPEERALEEIREARWFIPGQLPGSTFRIDGGPAGPETPG